jgi:hypothetical protein
MDKKMEYETPRASVRGVFLCENVASTSVKVAPFTQNDWGNDQQIGAGTANLEGDLWMGLY